MITQAHTTLLSNGSTTTPFKFRTIAQILRVIQRSARVLSVVIEAQAVIYTVLTLHRFNTTPMNNVELGKSYKLTLTVIEVTKNTATADNDGTLILAMGRQNHYGTIGTLKYSDIKVGAKIETTNTYKNSYNCIAGAAFGFDSPTIQWDFKCKVEFEEV